jgi:hypothetical protein
MVTDGKQPIRALGVIGPHVVQQRGRMGDVGSRHEGRFEISWGAAQLVGYDET